MQLAALLRELREHGRAPTAYRVRRELEVRSGLAWARDWHGAKAPRGKFRPMAALAAPRPPSISEDPGSGAAALRPPLSTGALGSSGSRPAWKPTDLQPLRSDHGTIGGEVAEAFCRAGTCVPGSGKFGKDDQARVIEAVRAVPGA